MDSNLSSQKRKTLAPQREVGRQRVAELLEAAAEVIQERGFEATTMAEIALRADARIGSLYRFFPSKDAVADALMDHYATVLAAAYDAVRDQAGNVTPEELADLLIDLLARLHPKARAVTALLDSRTDWTLIRLRFRAQALAGVRAALKANAPALEENEADDIAAVVLNNMKTMVGMMRRDAPTSLGAPDQLRLMNRLYLAARLTPARATKP
ncbi:TetR/AcrR family transcriptional regulator [Labrys sp. KNU-23]|nr:TetR/AcrR family transcriptional regulator [Labrys sp. KNU-23]